MTEIKHPLSVIDGRKIPVKEAFSWVLNYFNPHKKIPEIMPKVIDGTCGKMIMWHERDLNKFKITTNDIDEGIESDYNKPVQELYQHIDDRFDIGIYDPPYIDLKNRNDSDKYEEAFKYELIPSFEVLESTTILSSISFSELLNPDGILIAKVTDFHINGQIHGHHDFIHWFSNEFYIWDIVIYRFYKPIPNLNFYSKKCAKTHSYFLIFNKK